MNRGIDEIYFTRTLPPEAVAIAAVSCPDAVASELIDAASPVTTSSLEIWNASSDPAIPPDWTTPWAVSGLNIPGEISGSRTYAVSSQFFDLTNVIADDGVTPLFYKSAINSKATSINIVDAKGELILTPTLVQSDGTSNCLFHSLSKGLYWIKYVDSNNNLQKEMLKFTPVIGLDPLFATPQSYTLTGNLVMVLNVTPYYIRFTGYSCFQVLAPYGAPSNTPWFPRVRFPINPPVPEWAQQNFAPALPYLLASWVSGTVLDANVIQFERTQIYPDTSRYPDILVFDSNYKIKYALEGTDPLEAAQRGTAYPWQRNQIVDLDENTALVQILPTLDPTDIVFGFYCYREQDLLFTGIDCNPFTNPTLRDCVVRFYTRTDSDPFRRVYYQVINFTGADVADANNDPNPVAGDWTNVSITLIGDLFIGTSMGTANVTITDIRLRGGGLAPAYQNIPQSANFWDIGFIDGEPYPIGGALVVYLPYSILNTMTRDEVLGRINKTIPMGALAVVRYIDSNLQEWV